MQMTAKNTKDPMNILGLSDELTHENLHAAYKACRADCERDFGEDPELFAAAMEEIDWAYQELTRHLEEQNAVEDDYVLSAILIPGLSPEVVSQLHDDENVVYLNRRAGASATADLSAPSDTPSNPLDLPEIKTALKQSESPGQGYHPKHHHGQTRDSKPTATRMPPPKAPRPLVGLEQKPAVQVRAQQSRIPDLHQKFLNIIETTEQMTGSLLKKLREEAGVSIDELSTRTKISKKHIVAIEEERYDQLPAVVYFRGFLVSYLRYLGLNREDIADAITENYRSRMRLPYRPPGGR